MLEEPLVMVKRKDWGAKKYVSGLLPVIPPVQFVVVHFYTGRKGCYCPNTCREYVKRLQRRAVKERKLADIPFNFLISPSEEIYEGRGWDVTSDKSLAYSQEWGNKYDVTFIGNYLVKKPGTSVVKVLQNLIQLGIKKKYLKSEYEVMQIRDSPLKLEKIFDQINVKPSPGMIRQLIRLIWYGIDRENIDYIYNRVKQIREKRIRLF